MRKNEWKEEKKKVEEKQRTRGDFGVPPPPSTNVISSTFLTRVGQRMYFSFLSASVCPSAPRAPQTYLILPLRIWTSQRRLGGRLVIIFMALFWHGGDTGPAPRVPPLPDRKHLTIQKLPSSAPSPSPSSFARPPPCLPVLRHILPLSLRECGPWARAVGCMHSFDI